MRQEQEEASTEVTEVADGVLRLQLPIDVPGLRHVNCYALVDRDGAALVDPGHFTPESLKALERRLAAAGVPLPRVHTVLVTHSHGDHFGGTRWVVDHSGAQVVTHAAFSTGFEDPGHVCTDPSHDHDVDLTEQEHVVPFRAPTPWGTEGFGMPSMPWRDRLRLLRRSMGMRRRQQEPPHPNRRVRDGDGLRLAGRDWFVRHTPGHTVDHICLHDPEGGVLLSGDHVLPTITPHISGLSSSADPLAAFFASLEGVAALGVDRVLPAHGHPFDDLPGRVKAIIAHHEERLGRLQAISAELGWASVVDVSHQLFAPRSWGRMAESETYAHLEHLRLQGRAETRGEGRSLAYLVP
jgi:glyoxylase-like metal-dependent hydrolase (beta-lactamase superfamily II)